MRGHCELRCLLKYSTALTGNYRHQAIVVVVVVVGAQSVIGVQTTQIVVALVGEKF